MEMLCFRLPGHGDTTLKEMNLLRSRQHFCDVTIVASDKQTFKGHKVVLAACSPFLRDQFLLNPSSKLQVSMLHSSAVVCDLLQSCYTGLLQFSPEEIVNYLTAASYLQMEHIVERCRGALKKYMQPRHPTPPGFKTEETHGTPVIVSGSAHSVNSMSPPVGRSSPVQQHNHIELLSYENNTDMHPQSNNNHHNDAPLLDESCIKVSVSEDEETRHDDDVFEVYLPDEEQSGGDGREDTAVPPDGPPDACNSAGAFVACRDNGSNPAQGELSASGFLREGLAFKRRLPEPKGGRGRGRGRGLKKRKWVSPPQERQPAVAVAQQQDLWYLATAGMGSGFGLDYGGAEALKPGGYLALDLPRGDFGVGEAQGDEGGPEGGPAAGGVDDGIAHYALEDSRGGPGEGGSGLGGGVRPDEAGDESVAVVGSTSSAMGPVICEHCGMTFPSAHSLAVHARSNHLLYVCPCCGKHFHHAANLTRHMAVHRGAGKSHQCPLCYKTFTQKSTLIDHMNLHSGERPHHCAYCHARFAHKPALRRHLKEQHGKTTGQNSLHEQEEREREKSVREEAQEHLVSEQT